MSAILSHELKTYFHSLTAYVFGAFLLIFTGVGALLYNINSAVSNFEYVIDFCTIVFIVIVPILTMRVIAEERKQKTDQLLYSLPITTTQVILGKFLALMVIFLIPVCIISIYPLIFSRFGDVYLPTAYGTIFAFFIFGAALISIGIFISSLTENQGLAAGIGIAVLLVTHFSVQLSEYASTTAYSSLIAIFVIAVLIGVVIRVLTKQFYLAYGVTFILCAGTLVTYFVSAEKLEGLLPNIMNKISLYSRFTTFVDGIFDLTTLVYFMSVIVFFLFLSVQSLEKRRYN